MLFHPHNSQTKQVLLSSPICSWGSCPKELAQVFTVVSHGAELEPPLQSLSGGTTSYGCRILFGKTSWQELWAVGWAQSTRWRLMPRPQWRKLNCLEGEGRGSSAAKTGPKGKQSEEGSQVTVGGRPRRISGGRVTKGTWGEQKTGCSVYSMLSNPSLGLTYFSVYTISLLLLLLQHAVT